MKKKKQKVQRTYKSLANASGQLSFSRMDLRFWENEKMMEMRKMIYVPELSEIYVYFSFVLISE